MVLLKVLGILLAVVGIVILRYFPDISYQRPEMLKTGLFLATLALVLGIALIIFG
jgi:hypothetical protein